MFEFTILGASATSSTAKTATTEGIKANDAQLASEELQEQFKPINKQEPKEPEFVEDKGEYNQFAKDIYKLNVKLNDPDFCKTRTFTKDENGRYNDCPEIIEFNRLSDEFTQYLNNKLGEPAFEGQKAVIVSNGEMYNCRVIQTGGKLQWMGQL